MDIPENLRKDLLEAYIQVSMKLWNQRAVKYMPYNEALICHILYMQRSAHPETPYMNVKQLCETTGILKSQMNKTLNSLEKSGMIKKEQSTKDRRVIHVTLNESGPDLYEKEQQNISGLVDRMINKLGLERSYEAISIFNDIASEISLVTKER
ncbi:MAG: MarR family transcriptional regulator [Butyrivibrio sp.]